ncbi:LysR substrate-binding domain-containing protein [Telmatospirillum sp.]|uniref:LysR substrate-binding domain-containing protein n=1 Tax=Telmatospirillum sp. TaxID=2079197 RepID=UPI002840009F|nr:LysR substrate-binding domain-containing protein [Telmatospirillum sp.]MDR3439202.1 LysR substrate-binding domain-containing protein [Telmatospirillum sp.]
MTLEQLRIFVAVAERLHFTQAAQALGLTQSAVSAAIAALEGRYGVDLFHRIGRHVELSAAGTVFLTEAREVLAAAGQAETAFDELAGLRRGRLAVMGSQTIATYWLPPRLLAFHRAHPGITLDLTIGNTAQVAEAVASGEKELGFVEGLVDNTALEVAAVDDDRLALVVGQQHAWAADRALDRDDFLRLPWVLRESGSGTRAATEALLATRQLTLADVTVCLELPSNESVRSAIEAGAGATVLSLLVAATGLRAGVLKAAACALPTRRFWRLRHRERRLSGAARAFVASLGQQPAA